MPYPTSSDVAAGQPTSYLHYNSLRADAVYLGQLPADAVSLLDSLARYAHNLVLEPLATNRVRIPYAAFDPCCLVIDGHMCKAAADVDLPALTFSGVAATWYIFANWTAGATIFSLTANTSLAEAAGQRRIARIDWDGANLVYPSLMVYNDGRPGLYYARVNRTAAQAIASGAYTKISWDTEEADTDGMYTAASPTRVTIVHPGLYIVTTNIMLVSAPSSQLDIQILLNNTTAIAQASLRNALGSAIATARYFQAADYIEAQAQPSSGPINSATPTTMTVAALSA